MPNAIVSSWPAVGGMVHFGGQREGNRDGTAATHGFRPLHRAAQLSGKQGNQPSTHSLIGRRGAPDPVIGHGE